MQTLFKMAKIPKSKSNWDNAGVVFIQKAITVCDSNWQDRIKTQKRKKICFQSAMKIEKKSKNYLLIVLSPAKQNKIKSQDLFKKHQNWSKIDQNWSETYVISKSFLSFLFPPKNNAFLQVIFMKSENHFGVSKKNKLESYQ